MPQIIQFVHPGSEKFKRQARKGRISWHTYQGFPTPHSRKFLLGRQSNFLGLEKQVKNGDIAFWGEWEADSITVKRAEYSGNPYSLQVPAEVIKRPPYGKPHTTDPYVFGNRFLWTHCRQIRKIMRSLEPGSLVLFGNNPGGRENYRFHLDTVFVIGTAHASADRKLIKQSCSDSNFLKTNLNLLNETTLNKSTFYKAQMFEDNTELFSYVPCKPIDDREHTEAFIKPDIMPAIVRRRGFEEFFWKKSQRHCKVSNATEEEIHALWTEISSYLLEIGLFLGWGMQIKDFAK